MDEKENVKTEKTVLDDLGGSDGVSDDVDDDSGSESVSVPDGDDGQTSTGDISSGESSDVSSGDVGSDSVSAGDAAEGDAFLDGDTDISAHTEITVDYTENLLSLQTTLVSINSTLFLIFLFLVMSWTEKKISVSVRKFTRERRR